MNCEKCNRTFRDTYALRRHQTRKTPCAPIVERKDLPASDLKKDHICQFCGRTFNSQPSMLRHVRQYCKIATSDEGMEKLMDHTLRKQMERLEAQNAALQSTVERLTGLVEQQLTIANAPPGIAQQPHAAPTTVIQHQTNIGLQQNILVNVVSFDRDDRIQVPLSLVKAAFTENPRLAEYCRLDDSARTDAEKAAPYVLEALVDLVRRAHKDPLYRNIYLNPKRADQVLVLVSDGALGEAPPVEGVDSRSPAPAACATRWEVRSLVDAIRLLFDGVATNLHKIVVTDQDRTQLPLDIQSAASWVPNLYEDEPDKFVHSGKVPMAAHLQNTRPSEGNCK